MITIHGNGVTVLLPHQPDFRAPVTRQIVEMIALDGSIIRQISAFQQSAKKLQYSGSAREADAYALLTMIESSAVVTVSDGKDVFNATINDLSTPATSATGQRLVPVSFICMVSERIA